jgi:3-phytase
MSRTVISAHPNSSAREHSARRAIAHVFLTALVALLATRALTSAAWPVLSSDRPEGFGPSPGTDWPIGSLATGTVLPSVETDPSHHDGDTADDTAIWIHPTDPSLSLVIGDDKDGGLMVWGLDGKEVQYVDGPGYNNLDLRYNVPLAGTFSTGGAHTTVALVGVSDAGESQVDFFKVNPGTRRLEAAGSVGLSIEPYGGCMYHSPSSGKYHFIAPDEEGMTVQVELRDGGNGQVAGTVVRTFDVGDVTEGCVADDVLGHLYVGEEDVGIWKYGAEPSTGSARTQVDAVGAGHLVADVEGLSIYYAGSDQGYLIASSQGDSTVAVYTREGSNSFRGNFDVGATGTIDEVTESDGLDVTNVPLGGPFGLGLFAIHDHENSGGTASNVKFVPWSSIANPLGLVADTTWDPRLVGSGPGKRAPVAYFTFSPSQPRPGETVTFDASSSLSEEGTSREARWDWESDGTWDTAWSATMTAPHAFPTEDTFTVTLQVRDSNGLSDTWVETISVALPAPGADRNPPTVSITSPAGGATLRSATVTVTGTASDDVELLTVQVSTDGATWTSASGKTTWSGTVTLVGGPNLIRVRATDAAGNFVTATTSVFVDLSAPQDPLTLLGQLTPLHFAFLFAGAVAASAFALFVRRRRRSKGAIREGAGTQKVTLGKRE